MDLLLVGLLMISFTSSVPSAGVKTHTRHCSFHIQSDPRNATSCSGVPKASGSNSFGILRKGLPLRTVNELASRYVCMLRVSTFCFIM
jgi:hypothetical protein